MNGSDENRCPITDAVVYYSEVNILADYLTSLDLADTGMLNLQNNLPNFLPVDLACIYTRSLGPDTEPLYNAPHLRHCLLHQCPSMFKCLKTYCVPSHT